MRRIFWASDSTVKTNFFTTYPQTGIGQAFDRFVKQSVVVYNHAENARSTKTFMKEGRLGRIEEELSRGDFLFIQFGHNDENTADPKRFTQPNGEFFTNLGIYAETARKYGAYPVFITPLEKREFGEDGTLTESIHKNYYEAIVRAAEEYKVPLVDLTKMSRERLEEVGPAATKGWFMNLEPGVYEAFPDGKEDDVHLQYQGAFEFARLIAKGLKELSGIYLDLLEAPDKL